MNPVLCITFRFIQPYPLFHGSGDAGAPEWPPSPMRAFQALVNATSLRYRGQPLPPEVEAALTLIEGLRPSILAPDAQPSTVGYRAYVPHNQTDLVTAAWDRGKHDASIATHRMEKDIRPVCMVASTESMPALHYLYPLIVPPGDCDRLLDVIRPCVRSISALGWGIDQVAADATLLTQSEVHDASGYRWQPVDTGRHQLRVHRRGSLHALRQRHDRILGRLIDGQFTPVPPFTVFDIARYAHQADPLPRPHAVFKLIDENDDAWRYSHAKLIHVAGMVRHLAIETMRRDLPPWIENKPDWVNRVVRGKRDESTTDEEHRQFSYVPLPSIGHTHADAMIRNVIVVAPLGMERELEYLAARLDGQVLKPEGHAESCTTDVSPHISERIELQRFTPPHGKFIDTCYLGTARAWHTVTPVILDGHDDKKPEKTAKLIQSALQRAGIETPCTFTWQSLPFLKNCLSAHKYDRWGGHTGYHRPSHLKDLTAVHVSLLFEHPLPGPIAIGAGRHCGLGIFASVND